MSGLFEVLSDRVPKRSKTVQALAWLLHSPPLLSNAAAVQWGSSAGLVEFSSSDRAIQGSWLDALETQEDALLDWIDQAHDRRQGDGHRQLRLGRFAERLLEYFLLYGPSHRLVVANLPLRRASDSIGESGAITIGEIDFLLRDGAGHALHWELTVKYFLCLAQGSVATASDFVGPEGVETLNTKLDKLFRHQLQHKPPAPWATSSWRPQAFTRGWMFYRLGKAVPECALLDPRHNKGWWLPFEALHELGAADDLRYLELDKRDWLHKVSGLLPHRRADADTRPVLAAALPGDLQRRWHQQALFAPSARLIVQLKWLGEAQWVEVSRGFVLPPRSA